MEVIEESGEGGAPVRSKIEIPFLSPTLRVCEATQIGAYYRFHCR
jgi:hypothetical protein